MRMRRWFPAMLVLALLIPAPGCGGGGGGGGEHVPPPPGDDGNAPLLLAAGPNLLPPASDDSVSAAVDPGRVGAEAAEAVYELTTPADVPFAFDVLSRSAGNTGAVRISLAHLSDGGAAPAGGAESIANAGMVLSASGTSRRDAWIDAEGDGFARMSVRGSVSRDQVLAVETESGGGKTTAYVRVAIGPTSRINDAAATSTDYSGVLEETTLYSSDSWSFGLPAIAVSGDRTSIVCYEGDRLDPRRGERYELRLQHGPDGVHGGGTVSAGLDTGHWRDHEAAALFNVLAVVRSGDDKVTVRLSFDRGSTFGQEETFGLGTFVYQPRLVQVAMALDYSMAVLFWRGNRDGSTDLVLVTGKPSSFDLYGSPNWFSFDAPVVLHRSSGDVSPAIFGATWSDGGDLVVGYAYSAFWTNSDGSWTSTTQSRLAVLPHQDEFRDTLVEAETIVGRDPSVATIGSGDTMRVFYAYESRSGVLLRTSADGGRTFGSAIPIGDGTATNPTVLVRDQAGQTRVDVVYLASGVAGMELHLAHWDDFDGGPGQAFRLTTAEMIGSGTLPPGTPVPGAGPDAGLAPPSSGFRIRQVAWFGYDAVLDGDDVVVVYDEETFDAYTFFVGAPLVVTDEGTFGPAAAGDDSFTPADPPPLAEGMTELLPAPDPDDMHQLRLLRLD